AANSVYVGLLCMKMEIANSKTDAHSQPYHQCQHNSQKLPHSSTTLSGPIQQLRSSEKLHAWRQGRKGPCECVWPLCTFSAPEVPVNKQANHRPAQQILQTVHD
ncbi:hypothetical protein IRJ41_015081, partial [Triplophysa rosa]